MAKEFKLGTDPIKLADIMYEKVKSFGYDEGFNDGYDQGYNEGFQEAGEEASTEIDMLRLRMAKSALDHMISEGHWNEYYYIYRNALKMIAHHPCVRTGDYATGAKEMIALAQKTLNAESEAEE